MPETEPTPDPELLNPIIEKLRLRVPDSNGVGCFLCRGILEDLVDDGKLTGALCGEYGHPSLPREGELAHLKLEGIILDEVEL